MKIVQKYGGSSLADTECVRRVANRILKDAEGNRMLVVVSAQGKTTDSLTDRYFAVSSKLPSREADALLVTGEQMSAALLAAQIESLGGSAVSLNGAQVPIRTDGRFGDASIRTVGTGRIRREWRRGNIVIVTGFQGISAQRDLTTLGRGGSDTSAVALAAALKAHRCMIFTDVDGVYSADPRRVPEAVRFDSIHEDAMLNLALSGAKVLHPRAAMLAKKRKLSVEILTSFSDCKGTLISGIAPRRTGVTSRALSNGMAEISVVFAEFPERSVWFRLIEGFREYSLKSRYGCFVLSVSVPTEECDSVLHRFHGILY